MSEYVSKEQLKEFFEGIEITVAGRTRAEAIREVLQAIYNGAMELPTTDAVPVIRCYECKYFTEFEKGFSSDWDGSCRYWNTHSTVYSNFCGCGARMDKE